MNIKINIVFGLLLVSFFSYAQSEMPSDSVNTFQKFKQNRIERKTQRKTERKNFNQHFQIGGEIAYANVNSSVRFEEPNGIFSAKVDLERDLGFVNKKFIYALSFVYRITPRSGLFAYYYQINRKSENVLNRDIVFLDDTLKSGTSIHGTQNAYVLSFGYMLSILKEEYAFLGVYFNVYITHVNASVKVDGTNINKKVGLYTPMPNLGFLASFQLTKWMRLAGGIGVMFLNTYELSGSLHDANVILEFIPTKWLGISLGYYFFDVKLDVPVERYRAYLNYQLNGPTAGLWFRF